MHLCDVTAADERMQNPAHTAATLPCHAMQLLSRGVDVDACDGHGQTALHAAAEHGHAAMTQLLLACESKRTEW